MGRPLGSFPPSLSGQRERCEKSFRVEICHRGENKGNNRLLPLTLGNKKYKNSDVKRSLFFESRWILIIERSSYGIKYWFGYWRDVYGPDHL